MAHSTLMNSTDPWAKPLNSWTPRPPSPELEARIFGPRPKPARRRERTEVAPAVRWLSWGVPSLGTALVVASLSVHPISQPGVALASTNSAQLAALHSAAA